MLTNVNEFAFRSKINYLCSTEVEIPWKSGYLHCLYAIFRREIGEIPRRIRKIISNLVKIISNLGARKSIVVYKTCTMNVKDS